MPYSYSNIYTKHLEKIAKLVVFNLKIIQPIISKISLESDINAL